MLQVTDLQFGYDTPLVCGPTHKGRVISKLKIGHLQHVLPFWFVDAAFKDTAR